MSKPSSKLKPESTKSADDILASLMEDLKDVDTSVSSDNELGLDLTLLKAIKPMPNDENELLIDGVENSDDSLSLDQDLQINFDNGKNVNLMESMNQTFQSNPLEDVKPNSRTEELNQDNTKQLTQYEHKLETKFEAVPQLSVVSDVGDRHAGRNITGDGDRTVALQVPVQEVDSGDGEKTVAVAGYSQRASENYEGKVKVSVGQVRGNAMSSGYAAWGSSDSNLIQAENLRIAQEKILDLERDNEKLRSQNEELIAASEIVKERADLLTSQVHEFKSDRDSLEQSFKNENSVIKGQISRKDAEIIKATLKIEELESRMKFDLKKIRVRERELENRLELIRAEKNALVKTKDDQILDLRRKLDQVHLEVESYRQKCVELNKVIETNQESFKRTTRALRLAMANLELQDENKTPLKKVD